MILLRDTGRPQLVYGKRCKDDEIEHEIFITEFELLIAGTLQRNVPIGKTTADGMFIREGTRFFVEVDNETMTPKQMREKWVRYEKIDGFILLVCRTRGRLKRLMRSAERVKKFILFSRFEWLQMKNVKEKWIDGYGKRAEI